MKSAVALPHVPTAQQSETDVMEEQPPSQAADLGALMVQPLQIVRPLEEADLSSPCNVSIEQTKEHQDGLIGASVSEEEVSPESGDEEEEENVRYSKMVMDMEIEEQRRAATARLIEAEKKAIGSNGGIGTAVASISLSESGFMPPVMRSRSRPSSPSKNLSRFVPPLSLSDADPSPQNPTQIGAVISGVPSPISRSFHNSQQPTSLYQNQPPPPSNPTFMPPNLGQINELAATLDNIDAQPLQPIPSLLLPSPTAFNSAHKLLPSNQTQSPSFSGNGLPQNGPLAISNNPPYQNSAQQHPKFILPGPTINNTAARTQINSQTTLIKIS